MTSDSLAALPKLVERFSIMSVSYLITSIARRQYHRMVERKVNSSVFQVALESAVGFFFVRGSLAVVLAVLSHSDVAMTEILRETYLVLLSIFTSRYISANYLYR